jgi:hypothetical protein
MRERTAVLAVALALAIAFPAAAGADEVWVPPEGGVVTEEIAAQDGRLVWVGSLGPGPLGLIEGFGAEARPLPATRETEGSAIAGLDLGTDGRGRPVAVYSFHRSGKPDRLYRYDFAAGRARVMLASRKGCRLSNPHLERGVLHFAREGERSRPGCRPGIYAKRPGQPLRRLTTRAYHDFDVSGRVIAFIRSQVLRRGDTVEGRWSELGFSHVYLLRPGQRRPGIVASAGYRSNARWEDFGGAAFGGVTLDDGHVYWLRVNYDTGEEDLLRARATEWDPEVSTLSAAGRALPHPSPGAFPADGFAVDGDRIYYDSVEYDPATGSYGRSALARVTPLPPVFE